MSSLAVPRDSEAERPLKRLRITAEEDSEAGIEFENAGKVLQSTKEAAKPAATGPEVKCTCGETDETWPIVRCRYLNCTRKFFHAEYVGLPSNQNAWACDACKEQRAPPPPAAKPEPWITPADVEGMFSHPAAPRGPAGDIYGLGALSQQDMRPPQYLVPPAALSNPIKRIKEQAELEKNLVAVTTWRADVQDLGLGEVEWDVDEEEFYALREAEEEEGYAQEE